MGASRKLQGEIDRVLKKVQEGVEVFDQIWNKVYETDNVNQKEKFEADLKKEIKKLQRYRDQIKTWIQSSEIKDKKVSASYEQALVDARKVIEQRMERFKICEKETKTKAFSKEGLGQQPKTDPKEKAKSETRDWLNNVVSELESQIDSFEAEIEGISFKKGKSRPPRLAHLETSIIRHKAHIVKLELILRLLDNDELSPEQVNDVKYFLDDYVERNQDDFDDFDEIDDLYSSLPLDKVESLEDLVTTGPLVKGAQIHTLKPSLAAATQVTDQGEETASRDSSSDAVVRTPPPIGSGPATASSPVGYHATPVTTTSSHSLPGLSSAASILPSPGPVRGALDNAISANPSSPFKMAASTKENEIATFHGRQSSPSASDSGLVRGIGREGLSGNPLSPVIAASSSGSLGGPSPVSDITKRNISGNDDRIGSVPLSSPPANRMIIPQVSKGSDGTSSVDSGSVSDSAALAGRMFSSSATSGMQWNPGSPFTIQNEVTQFTGRTEIMPDQREKFLQRYQQVQQGQTNILGMPLTGGNHKQLSGQQQSPLLQQFNSQSFPVSSHAGLGVGGQPANITITSGTLQQQPNSNLSQAGEHSFMPSGPKDIEPIHVRIEEQQQEQNIGDDSTMDSASGSGPGMNTTKDGDTKPPYTSVSPTGESGSLATVQHPRDTDLSPGQHLQSSQPSISLGGIGQRSVSDTGAIGDSSSGSTTTPGAIHDQLNNLQMLEAAFYKLPQPKDSERPRSYNPRHPAITPPSYPQSQAAIVNNPAFWEKLGMDNYATDTLFFAFYHQQNSYQQYLAARELKKQSWRYHKKYNTWFQRHEEPKVATDEFEQGTYVYFDFHIGNEDSQPGWCQRIKTEFTFEYNYLEDELA